MTTDDLVLAARTAAWLSKQLEVALAGVGLTLPQYRLLTFLSGGPERASALAGRLDVTRPTLTALVDGVVQRGYVARVTPASDRRTVSHELTPEGTAMIARADAAVAAQLGEVVSHLSGTDASRAVRGLLRWRDALEARRRAVAAR